MKNYNVQNYIRYKEDLEACIERIPNKEFNFSSNPSFATSSDGSFTQSTFFKNPKTFITQVGLYNDDGELLAVAKLSKPLLKSYSREAIVKVKLDF